MRNTFLVTNKNRFGFLGYGKVLFLFLLMSACFVSSLPAGEVGHASSLGSMMTSGNACPTKEELIQKTRTLQMPFIANNGQMDNQVMFYAKTFGGTVFVTKEGEIVYALPDNGSASGVQGFESDKRMHNHRGRIQDNRESCITKHASVTPPIGLNSLNKLNVNRRDTVPVSYLPPIGLNGLNKLNVLNSYSLFNSLYVYLNTTNPSNKISRTLALKETLVGANILGITGAQPAVTTVNYFTGNDKSKWKTNVPTYNRVNLGEVYKGVELSLKAYSDNVEKLFCVKPGASPEFIKVQLGGSKSLRVNQNGQLETDTELGLVKFTRPIAYQEVEGKRMEVAVEYKILSSVAEGKGAGGQGGRGAVENLKPKTRNQKLIYGFTVASYDKTKDLIIDPLLASTYLGGSDSDIGNFLTLDGSGNVYVMGHTESRDFPTMSGVYDTSFNSSYGYDVFVSKLDRELTSMLASTYLGGSSDDYSFSLTLDTSGNVYVTGLTLSTNFPTTSGAYGTSNNGYYDAFVSKLDSELMSLLASTYLGGTNYDGGNSLILDSSGNVYVTGNTESTNFPTTNGAYDTAYNGGSYYFGGDVFVSKLDGGLTSLLASTYLGGSNDDYGYYITLDISENVYVTGNTKSSDFPTTSGAYDTSFDGYGHDVFVSKLDSGLTRLLASTYLGGLNGDSVSSLTLDIDGNAYVTGFTDSRDFPTTSGAYDTSFNGSFNDYDVFVSKLDGELKSLLASTYLGGSNFDFVSSLTLDSSENVYVTGFTRSTNFPTTSGAYDISFDGQDVFISKLDSGLKSLLASTSLGGSSSDGGNSLALDTNGSVYVLGSTWSANFPVTNGAYDTSYNGRYDVFVSKLDGNLSATDECLVESITAVPKKVTIRKNGSDDVTITVAGTSDCPVEGVTVTATINGNGKRLIMISPNSQGTDANGQAVFSIMAKDGKGTAVVKFKANGLNKVATVQVKVR